MLCAIHKALASGSSVILFWILSSIDLRDHNKLGKLDKYFMCEFYIYIVR